MKPIRIIIVDDHPLIKEGIKQILSFYEDMQIVGEGNNGQEAIELISTHPCDLLLLDINMPILNGLETAKKLKQSNPELSILLLTVENDYHTLKEAVDLKVNGYILKESAGSTLIDAIRHIHSGEHFIDPALSKHVFNILQDRSQGTNVFKEDKPADVFKALSCREKEILYYISKGLTNKQIGTKLYLSEKTIRNCATKLFKKIDVTDRVHATILAIEHKLELPVADSKE